MSPVSLALHHVMRRGHREDEQLHSKGEGEAAGDGESGREATAFRRKTLTTKWPAIKGEGRAGSAVRRDGRPKRVLEPLNPDSERPCMPGPASEHKPTGLSRSLLCLPGSPQGPSGRENWQRYSLLSYTVHSARAFHPDCVYWGSPGTFKESILNVLTFWVLKPHAPTFQTWKSFPWPHSSQNRGNSRRSTVHLLSTDDSLQIIYK